MCRNLTIEALLCGHQHSDIQLCALRLASSRAKSTLFSKLSYKPNTGPCKRPQLPQTCLKESICPSCKSRGFDVSNFKRFDVPEEGRLAKKEQVKRIAIYSEVRPPTAAAVAYLQSAPQATAAAAASTRRPRPLQNKPPRQYRKTVDGPALSPGASRPGQHPGIPRKPVGRGRRETTFGGNKNEKMAYFIGSARAGIPFEDPSITAGRECTTPDSLRRGTNKPLPPPPLRVGDSRRRRHYYSPLPSPKRQLQQIRQKTPPPPPFTFVLESRKLTHAEVPIYHTSTGSSPPRFLNAPRWPPDTPYFSPSPFSPFTPSDFLSPGKASIAASQLSPVEPIDTQHSAPLNGWLEEFSDTFDRDSRTVSDLSADWDASISPVFEQTPYSASSRRSSPLIGSPPSLSCDSSHRSSSSLEIEIPRLSLKNKIPAPVSSMSPTSPVSRVSPAFSSPKFVLQPTVYKHLSAHQIPVRGSSRRLVASNPLRSSFRTQTIPKTPPKPPPSRKPLAAKDNKTNITRPEAINLEFTPGPAKTPLRTAKTPSVKDYTPVAVDGYSLRSKTPKVEVINKAESGPMRGMPNSGVVVGLPSIGGCERMHTKTKKLIDLWQTGESRGSDDKGRKYKY